MVNNTKYVTIATDASTSTNHGISTWACYIRGPRGVIKHVARFNEYSDNTAWLETKSLANALVLADKNINLAECKIVIYNEVEYVLRPLVTRKTGRPLFRDAERTAIINDVMMPILEKAISWEIRDVKAHTKEYKKPGAAKKYILNRWCDLSCRGLLREQVKAQNRTTAA